MLGPRNLCQWTLTLINASSHFVFDPGICVAVYRYSGHAIHPLHMLLSIALHPLLHPHLPAFLNPMTRHKNGRMPLSITHMVFHPFNIGALIGTPEDQTTVYQMIVNHFQFLSATVEIMKLPSTAFPTQIRKTNTYSQSTRFLTKYLMKSTCRPLPIP